ncbi:unnamed protein product, partial [Rotaria sp. Silwood2]
MACLIRLVASCSWYGGKKGTNIKLVTPCEQTSHDHVQALIRIVGYTPFHTRTDVSWCNDETILIDATLSLVMNILQTESVSCFVRSTTPLTHILLALAETSSYDRIVVLAYGILAQILSDDHLKELKIADNI